MALNTTNTFLYYKGIGANATPANATKLVDILGYPDLGGTPSKIDTTTLSATKFKTSMLGLQELPDLTFEALYSNTEYGLISNLASNTYEFSVYFGANGVDGKFTWQGKAQVFPIGGGVDEVRKMQIICSAETEITKS